MRKCIAAIPLSLLALAATANADLIGGAYTTSSNLTSWDGTPVYASVASASLSSVGTGQGQPAAISGATYTCLSELVTPTSAIQLGAIAIMGSFGDTSANPVRLHVYPLSSSGGTNLLSSSDAYYFPGTDLLNNGSGAGLAITAGGSGSGEKQLLFSLSNGPGSNDQVTLNANTTYAVEFWVPINAGTFTWYRLASNTPQDPGGQMMGSKDASNFSTSRNAITALGLAGGAPRTGAIALYAVPEPTSMGLIGLAAAGLISRRRRA